MKWKSTPARYGAVAIAIHWITALAVFGLLASGFIAANETSDATRTGILRIHGAIGGTVFVLTILRIAWWLFADTRPAAPSDLPGWQARSSRVVHVLLYALVIVMGASGIGMILLSGAGGILWFGSPGPLPNFNDYPPRAAHGIAFLLLLGLTVMHVAAALYHQFIRRDRLLARMSLGG